MGKKAEMIAQLKKLARKAHDTRLRRQYDIARLYLQAWKKLKLPKSWICHYREYTLYTVISEKLPKNVGLEPFCNHCRQLKEGPTFLRWGNA